MFQALLESASEAIIVVNEQGRIVLVNKRTEDMFQYGRDELLGRTVELLVPDRIRHLHAQHRANYLSDLRTRPMGLGLELSGRRKDGTEFPVEISLSYVKTGEGVLVMSYITDITERVKAEQRLAHSEEQYRRFFEEDLTGDFIATAEGKITACNPAFVRMFGFASAEEAMSFNLFSVYPSSGVVRELLESLHKERKLEYYEAELRRRDGKLLYVVENVIGTFNEKGELTEIKGYIFDDTNRKKLEEQLRQSQKMDAVGKLAGGIAHDFNNLISAIVLYSELLLDDLPADSPMRSQLEEIMKVIDRSIALTRQLMIFSRRQAILTELVELNVVVAEMEKMLRRLIGEHIELVTVFTPKLGRVKADKGNIEQIIMNLVINARDAMPKGGKLTIETANVELDETYAHQHLDVAPGFYVMLAVSDTGYGMNAETQAHIFEPFFTTKEPGKGTGLGLATVYSIVKQCGGNIWVYSEPEHGSTFKIYLPLVSEAMTGDKRGRISAPVPRGSETILLVEDETVVRNLARVVLMQAGYTVLEASNGEEALKICESHEGALHLVLTDVVMPKLGGSELVKRIALQRPEMKVIYMSAYTDKTIAHHGVVEPAMAFLQKPFTRSALVSKVREVLDAN